MESALVISRDEVQAAKQPFRQRRRVCGPAATSFARSQAGERGDRAAQISIPGSFYHHFATERLIARNAACVTFCTGAVCSRVYRFSVEPGSRSALSLKLACRCQMASNGSMIKQKSSPSPCSSSVWFMVRALVSAGRQKPRQPLATSSP